MLPSIQDKVLTATITADGGREGCQRQQQEAVENRGNHLDERRNVFRHLSNEPFVFGNNRPG